MYLKKGPVAVFWDLGYLDPVNEPQEIVQRIRHLGGKHGEVKFVDAYIGRMLQNEQEVAMVDTLKACDVRVHRCPTTGARKKPTIHHTMELDITFHVAFDHPETSTVVFITGERDFTYCSNALRQRGVRVVVLVQNRPGRLKQADANTYWPRPSPVKGKKGASTANEPKG